MLSTILISIVVVAVVFAVVNKFTKKQEKPIEQPSTIEEEPLGYETSSLAELEQPACLYPGVAQNDPGLVPVDPEEPLVLAKPPAKKPKKTSAKPKAPKKKKNA